MTTDTEAPAPAPRRAGASHVRESPLKDVCLTLVDSLDEALALKRWLGERRETPLGVDTETEGLDPFRHDLRLVQVGDMRQGWSIPWPLWGGLAQEILDEYQGDFVAHNCFSEETEFITKEGIRTFIETVGTTQEVWTERGWKKADIRCYGTAPVMELILAPYNRSRSTVRHTVRVTPNHRWIADRRQWRDGAHKWVRLGEIRTLSLRQGDRILAEAPLFEPIEDSEGFRHGLILADGAACSDGKAYQIRLCGWKEKYKDLFKSYTYPRSAEGDPVVNRYHPCSPYDLKTVPPEDAGSQYICNFIAGWAELDGSNNSDPFSRLVHTTRKDNAEWIQRIAPTVGWLVTGVTETSLNKSKWARAETSYAITLSRDPAMAWTIRDIVPASSEEEEVYCAEVAEVGRFSLAPGIYTANSSFDWRFMHKRGDITVPWHKLHDTMTLATLDDPTRLRGLKPLSSKLIDRQATAGERALSEGMRKNAWTWATVPYKFPAYWAYAALDPVLTCHLWNYLFPRVDEDCPQVYSLERGITRVCAKMMLKGMQVDRKYIQENIARLNNYSQESRRWLEQAHGIKNPLSARQISNAIEKAGWQIIRYLEDGEVDPSSVTKTGLPRADKETLTSIRDGQDVPAAAAEIAKFILGVRHIDKVVGSYLENFQSIADADGLVHAQIHPLQARTGRMSITDPALQTLHRDDKIVRGCFVPREGHVFISCDYDQIELRLAAHYSQDKGLIQAFQDADQPGGLDFFSAVASDLFRAEVRKGDRRRSITKSVTYAYLFGGGLEKMAVTAGVPVEQMRPIREDFLARFPGLATFAKQTEREARAALNTSGRAAIRTPSGRRLPVDEERIYAGVNFKIQGTAAEVLKKGILDLDAAGLGDYLLLPIHDEILCEIPVEDADEAARTIETTLTDRETYRVPLTCGANVMQERWVKAD